MNKKYQKDKVFTPNVQSASSNTQTDSSTQKAASTLLDKEESRKRKMEFYTLITSISTGVIALLALLVSYWQGYLARENNIMSVTPSLHFVTDSRVLSLSPDSSHYKIDIANQGIGPAYIKSVEVFYNQNKIMPEQFNTDREYLVSIAADMAIHKQIIHSYIYGGSLTPESVIVPNSSFNLLDLSFSAPNPEARNIALANLSRINIRVVYSSFYLKDERTSNLIFDTLSNFVPFTGENMQEFRKLYPTDR